MSLKSWSILRLLVFLEMTVEIILLVARVCIGYTIHKYLVVFGTSKKISLGEPFYHKS